VTTTGVRGKGSGPSCSLTERFASLLAFPRSRRRRARSAAQAEHGEQNGIGAPRASPMLIALLATCRLSATAWADDTSARLRTRSQHAAPKPALYEAEIAAAVESVRDVWPVPPELVRAVMRQESNFDPQALSRVGAIGLMQVMPRNGARVGFSKDELWEPAKNIVAGVRLLAVYLKHYEGDLISALVAYNAHPEPLGAPVPRNGETPDYVLRVLKYFREYSAGAPGEGSKDQGSSGAGPSPRTHSNECVAEGALVPCAIPLSANGRPAR